jgi:hypothetical protein
MRWKFMDSLRDLIYEELTTLDTDKIEATDITTANIGRFYTSCASVETPDGIIDTFTFKDPPTATAIATVAPGSEIVYVNGTRKTRVTHYDLVTNTVVFTAGNIPAGGEVVTADLIALEL